MAQPVWDETGAIPSMAGLQAVSLTTSSSETLFSLVIGRTDAEAEAPVLWPPEAMSRLVGKDPAAGKD